MKRFAIVATIVMCMSLSAAPYAVARGSGEHGGYRASSKAYSAAPGTGSKSSYTSVRGYTKKNGTYVAPSKRSTADHNFNNNWSTKGNTNLFTAKFGNRVEPPKKR